MKRFSITHVSVHLHHISPHPPTHPSRTKTRLDLWQGQGELSVWKKSRVHTTGTWFCQWRDIMKKVVPLFYYYVLLSPPHPSSSRGMKLLCDLCKCYAITCRSELVRLFIRWLVHCQLNCLDPNISLPVDYRMEHLLGDRGSLTCGPNQ